MSDLNILDDGTTVPLIVAPPLHYASGIADLRVWSAILRHVSLVLEYTGGSRKWAAEELAVDPSTLWRWIKSAQQKDNRRTYISVGRKLAGL